MHFDIFVHLIVLEIYCLPPMTPTDGMQFASNTLDSNVLFAYGSIVSYICLSNQRFEDGRTTKYIQCGGVGQWNETSFTCDGQFLGALVFYLC